MVKKVTTARGGARKRTSEKPPDSDSDAISSGFESEVSEDDGSIEDFAFGASSEETPSCECVAYADRRHQVGFLRQDFWKTRMGEPQGFRI